jgi:hypothetical protein
VAYSQRGSSASGVLAQQRCLQSKECIPHLQKGNACGAETGLREVAARSAVQRVLTGRGRGYLMLRRVCSVRRAFSVQYSYRAAAQLVCRARQDRITACARVRVWQTQLMISYSYPL